LLYRKAGLEKVVPVDGRREKFGQINRKI